MPVRLPAGPGELTERHHQVLALLARGLTNYEIAKELGISLEGAKYHVREIMTRLNVESREEAVAVWRREQRPFRRMRRAIASAFFAAGPRWVGAALAGVVVVGVAAVAILLAAIGGDDSGTNGAAPVGSSTATAAGTSTAATPSPAAPATITPVTVTGLFQGAPPNGGPAPVVRLLGARPASAFPVLDGNRTVIYDVKDGRTIDSA